MTVLRGVLVLAALTAVALVVSYLTTPRAAQDLPAGTTHSYSADGAQGLYQWFEALGRKPSRVDDRGFQSGLANEVVVLLQVENTLSAASRTELEGVLRRGGTIVAAGDSLPMRTYLTTLGVNLDPIQTVALARTAQGDSVVGDFRNRLRAAGARTLLSSERGDALAVELSARGGRVIAVASATPFTNAGLRDAATARWVYRDVISTLPATAVVGFDEAHHNLPTTFDVSAPEFESIVLDSAAGRAVLFAIGLVFVYLLLNGSVPGPALRPVTSGSANRTMFEHVQAIAGLYRRSRQLQYLREHFLQHYRRVVGRALGVGALEAADGMSGRAMDPGTRSALQQAMAVLEEIGNARSERQLIEAVTRAETTLELLPRAARGTLTS